MFFLSIYSSYNHLWNRSILLQNWLNLAEKPNLVGLNAMDLSGTSVNVSKRSGSYFGTKHLYYMLEPFILLGQMAGACILQELAGDALYSLMLTILAIFILVLEGCSYRNARSSFSAQQHYSVKSFITQTTSVYAGRRYILLARVLFKRLPFKMFPGQE